MVKWIDKSELRKFLSGDFTSPSLGFWSRLPYSFYYESTPEGYSYWGNVSRVAARDGVLLDKDRERLLVMLLTDE